MRLRATAVWIGVALGIALIVWMRPLGDEPSGRSSPTNAAGALGEKHAKPGSSPSLARSTRPTSLDGTEVDGALVIDASGRFVVTRDAIDLFDYYLSTLGEEPDEVIHARIVDEIEARLDAAAAAEARALLDLYLDYRRLASELLTGPSIGEDTARRLQYIRELRREVFGAEVALALFGEEENRWFIDLERQRILADGSLDAEARTQRLDALDDHESPGVIAARDAARAHRLLRDQELQLRAEGAGPTEIARLREERFGTEGAQRLADLDAARKTWGQRFEAYRNERDQNLMGVPDDQRSETIAETRARHFEGAELIRVRALDRAADSAAAIEATSSD